MDSYEKFMKKLDSLPIKSPRTQSNVEIEILKRLMTPEEAELGSHLSGIPEPAVVIAERAGMDAADLKVVLDAMVGKGAIFKVYTEEPLYCLVAMIPGIYEFQVGRLSVEDVKLWERYYDEKAGKVLFSHETPILRVLPVNQSITPEMTVYQYEEVEKLIDKAVVITLADCICRTNKKLIGEGCDAPVKDTCIYLDAWGDYFAENKFGRRATKEEAKAVLARSREAGLVLNALNVQDGSFFICSCCGCCCAGLRGINELELPTAVAKSNYLAVISSDDCTGCGACVESCHVHALALVDDVAVLKQERCIGCGVCVGACNFDAISMKRKDEIEQPPANAEDLMVKRVMGSPKE
ncbi:MAG: 4Fe-4S binding protein [Desulfobacterales bacterium]|nr:4Fe-4S binding protein [Desulfobacterales bacterium]